MTNLVLFVSFVLSLLVIGFICLQNYFLRRSLAGLSKRVHDFQASLELSKRNYEYLKKSQDLFENNFVDLENSHLKILTHIEELRSPETIHGGVDELKARASYLRDLNADVEQDILQYKNFSEPDFTLLERFFTVARNVVNLTTVIVEKDKWDGNDCIPVVKLDSIVELHAILTSIFDTPGDEKTPTHLTIPNSECNICEPNDNSIPLEELHNHINEYIRLHFAAHPQPSQECICETVTPLVDIIEEEESSTGLQTVYHGPLDFAEYDTGALVLTDFTSPTYQPHLPPSPALPFVLMDLFSSQVQSILGNIQAPIWQRSRPVVGGPTEALTSSLQTGHCWAMNGSYGTLTVKLSHRIRISGVSLAHIPRSGALDIRSAPRDFEVFGVHWNSSDTGHEDSTLLVTGRYEIAEEMGDITQIFPVTHGEGEEGVGKGRGGDRDDAFDVVSLRVFSNHGHPEYTCLYKLQVHGTPV